MTAIATGHGLPRSRLVGPAGGAYAQAITANPARQHRVMTIRAPDSSSDLTSHDPTNPVAPVTNTLLSAQ